MVVLIEKICKVCGKMRKFAEGSERDKKGICGECWDWEEAAEMPPEA